MDLKEFASLTRFLAEGASVMSRSKGGGVQFDSETVEEARRVANRVDRAVDRYVAMFHEYPSFERYYFQVARRVAKYLLSKGTRLWH
jgi:hypothetical protein